MRIGIISENRCFGLRLAGDAIEELDDRGNRIVDDTLLILLNAHHEAVPFILPAHRRKVRWQAALDTSESEQCQARQPRSMRGGEAYELKGRSLALLRLPKHVEARKIPMGSLRVRVALARGVAAAQRSLRCNENPFGHLSLAIHAGVRLRRSERGFAVSARARDQRYLCIADFSRARGQPAWL